VATVTRALALQCRASQAIEIEEPVSRRAWPSAVFDALVPPVRVNPLIQQGTKEAVAKTTVSALRRHRHEDLRGVLLLVPMISNRSEQASCRS
jgi:hypothetical protein